MLRARALQIFLILIGFGVVAMGAIPKSSNLATVNSFLSEGTFRGGKHGSGFSLLSVKRVYSSNGKSERLIFEIGDRNGKIYNGSPSYFHAQLFRNPSELSLDLAQVLKSKVSNNQLKELFRQSKLIENIEIMPDREDHSTHFNMRFKSPIKMRVFTLSPKKSTPKLVIDVTKI